MLLGHRVYRRPPSYALVRADFSPRPPASFHTALTYPDYECRYGLAFAISRNVFTIWIARHLIHTDATKNPSFDRTGNTESTFRYTTPSQKTSPTSRTQHDIEEQDGHGSTIADCIEGRGRGSDQTSRDIHREHKALTRKTRYDTGNLSHDWRIPLDILESFPPFESSTPSTPPFPRGFRKQTSASDIRPDLYTEPPRMPEVWTQVTFLDHVLGLCSYMPLRRVMLGSLMSASLTSVRPQGIAQAEDVAQKLERLFYRSDLRQAISIDACNASLLYFYKRGMFDKARSLYVRMEHLCMDIPATTFDVLLSGSSFTGDLASFSFLLSNMVKRGFQPTEDTWANLLKVVESDEVKEIILQKMMKRNALNNRFTVQNVVKSLIRVEMSKHLYNNQPVNTVLDRMRRKFGPDWLSTDAGNSILAESCKSWSMQESLELLHNMISNGFRASEDTMTILLAESRAQGQFELSLEILQICQHFWNLKPRNAGHEILFKQAWRSHQINLARTVWISACLHGLVTFGMQRLLIEKAQASVWNSVRLSNLATGADKDQKDVNPLSFVQLAGPFVLGLDSTQVADGDLSLIPSAEMEPTSNPRIQSILQSKLALQSQLATFKQARFRYGLIRALRDALAMDMHWQAKGFWTDAKTQQDLLRHRAAAKILRYKEHPVDGHISVLGSEEHPESSHILSPKIRRSYSAGPQFRRQHVER